ncbi:hypothetical protein V2J09_017983 [Rumex salicifolius]
MAKVWKATLRRTQAAAKKRVHLIFGSMSVANVNDDFDDENIQSLGDVEIQQVEKFLSNGDYFIGQWLESCPHGNGKYLWADGCMYEGEWFRGQTIGKGRFNWPSGATYEGEFKSGYMDGKGTYIGPNGETYKGFWMMNSKHGNGTMSYENGDHYEGEWRHGVQEGEGKYKWVNGNKYEGEWKNGMICGKGKMTWAGGNHFEGDWVDGLPEGEGIFRWQNGSYYEGCWSNDLKDQMGTLYPSEASGCRALNWDPQTLYKDIIRDVFICPVERIPIFPSQKKLTAWKSSKLMNPRVRLGRMSIDSRLNATTNSRTPTWESTEGSFSSERSYRNSVGSREDIVVHGNTNLESLMPKVRPLKIPKVGKKQGETITKGHKNYDLMLNLQLGIRHAVGKQAPPTSLELKNSAFDPKEKYWTKFPREGSKHTPPHNSCEFKWKDYCPLVFRALRKLFKVDAADYMLSICGNDALRELSSPGKSGSFFYLSNDDRYMIKTVKKAEVKVNSLSRCSWLFIHLSMIVVLNLDYVLIRMLSPYYNHVRCFENTLVTKFFGLHCVKLTGTTQKKVRFIIMGNLMCTEYTIHRRFDLKGSSLGRSIDKPEEELDASTILKDLDLNFIFRLQKSWFQEFCRQVDKDCELLENERIMDYSMLVGIHFREASKAGDLIPSGARTPVNSGKDDMDNDGTPCRPKAQVDPAWWASIGLGNNMPARVERGLRRNDGEVAHVMEPTGEYYDVVMFFGIIDILQDYDISKKLEHAYKSMQYDPTSISAVDPKLYSKRFRDFIFRIFAEDI